jgi:diguanylate cyclase (GGDEF)-like protein
MVLVRVAAAMRTPFDLNNASETIRDTAYTDRLTGLRNQRCLLDRLDEEVSKARRYDYPVSCVVFDIDEVQPLDKELGLAPLDDLLVEIGLILRNYSRAHDVLARYDGTLFAAILPHTPLPYAIGYVDKILRELDTTTFSDPSFPTRASLRAGIVSCQNGSAYGAEYVLGEAMRGLLQAKSTRTERLVARNLNQ